MTGEKTISASDVLDHIQKELIKADIDMQLKQEEAWDAVRKSLQEEFEKNPNVIDALESFPSHSQYLEMQEIEVSFTLNTKKEGFWKRLQQSWQTLQGKSRPFDFNQFEFSELSRDEAGNIRFNLKFGRKGSGAIKAEKPF